MKEIHVLKTWPKYFQQIEAGDKTFEIRKNDRGFKPDDILILEEWNPETEKYTGEVSIWRIGYLLQGAFGIPSDVCVMSLLVPARDDWKQIIATFKQIKRTP